MADTEKKEKSLFEQLFQINVNDHTEPKNGLTYLTWSWAWAEFKKQCPDATYEIKRNPQTDQHFWYDENLGYEVRTSVTVNGLTHEMWLPVMDSANNAMKSKPYQTTNKWGKTRSVPAATMFDINKSIMRCLTKNLAMFGLGLYIYAGEDLPESDTESNDANNSTAGSTAKKEAKAPEPYRSERASQPAASQRRPAGQAAQPRSAQTASEPALATEAQLKTISILRDGLFKSKGMFSTDEELYKAFKTQKRYCSKDRAYMIIDWFHKNYPELAA